ncbi:MAG: hypothetical protein ACREM6_12565 [Vulcanimicrobiaceae bacterium]
MGNTATNVATDVFERLSKRYALAGWLDERVAAMQNRRRLSLKLESDFTIDDIADRPAVPRCSR